MAIGRQVIAERPSFPPICLCLALAFVGLGDVPGRAVPFCTRGRWPQATCRAVWTAFGSATVRTTARAQAALSASRPAWMRLKKRATRQPSRTSGVGTRLCVKGASSAGSAIEDCAILEPSVK